MRNRSRNFLFCLSLAGIILLAACGGGGGSQPIAVTLSQTSPQTLKSGGTLTISATVSNDSSNKGVTWTLSPATACGTLSGAASSATYTAPQSSSLTAACTATITATSVADASKMSSVQVTVNPISVSIAGAAQQSATAGGSPLSLSATLTNDPANAGITWSLSPASGCGSVSSSGTSATFTPPAAAANAACTATVTATSVSDNTKKSTVTINVTLPPITLSLSPNTSQTVQAGGTLPLAATIGNDFGNKGVTWTVSPTSSCGSISANGTSATYTAPTALASACTATITVTSVADTTKTAAVTATVNPISVTMSPNSAQTLAPSQTLALTGTISNDATSSGLTWSISPATGCGALSGTTGASVTYTAPAPLASQCSATVAVASTADNSKQASVAVTVNPIAVTLSPAGPLTLGQTAIQNIQAAVANDIANKGVSWTISPASGCGSLSGGNATSVTYNAPTTLTSACTATLTAASVTDNAKSASVQVTVNPITIGISPASSQSLFAGQTLSLAATLSNDGAAQGVSWSLNPATGCGSLAANSGNSNTYTAPITLNSQCTATVTVTSVTDNTKTAQVNVTVSPAIVVSLSPNTAQTLWAGGTLQITPTVSNDSGNKGVSFTLNPTNGCGTLSSYSAASGTPVTYSAPASLSSQCNVTVTATSVSDGTKLATLSITVNPTISVTLSPSSPQFVNAGKTLQITPTVSNDVANQGVTLALNPSSGCGALSSNSVTSGTVVTYTAPTTLNNSCTVKLTATSVADSSKSATLDITANPAVVVTLSPNAQQNLDAGGTLQITPTVSNDGANKGVNFTLNPATGCGSVAPTSNVASGTAITYTAPSSLSNSCSVTVTATSITDNTKSASVNISVNLALALPSPNPSSLGSATVGGNYQGSINAAGGYGTYTWTINGTTVNTNGTPLAIANGLSGSNTGGNTLTISGAPTSATTTTFQVTVKDSTGMTVGPYTYSITANNPSPLVLPTPSPNLLPTGTVGGNYQAGINAQGGIPGYTFTVNGSTVNTNGTPLSIGDGLSVSNTGGNTLVINGTPNAAQQVSFQVSVKDSSANPPVGPYTYTINVINPTPLTINTSQQEISNGLQGAPYGAWINASGGSGDFGNYVFSVVNGVGTGLPTGLSFASANSGQITGTPTTAGTYTFQVMVTDTSLSAPNNTATSPTYTVVISNGPDGSANHWLYGQYAFLFRGFVDNTNNNGGGNNALYQSASIGSFFADGNGNITGGLAEVNDGSSFHNKVPFTGIYSIGADNRGVMKLCVNPSGNTCQAWITSNLGNPSSQNNVFVLSVGQIENLSLSSGNCPTSGASNTSCPVYTSGHWTNIDDLGATPSGAHGQGQLFRQDPTQFASTTTFQSSIAGNWAFGFAGEDASYNSMAAGGVFSADNVTNLGGSVSGGVGITDINDNQVVSSTLTVSGSYNTAKLTASNGRFGSVVLSVTSAPTGYPADYVGYMINRNQLLLLSNDAHTSNSSGMVSGIAYKQQQSNYASMPSKVVMYMSGASGGGASDAFVAQATCSGGVCTVNASEENDGGTYSSNKVVGSYTTAVSTYGRVTLSPAPVIFYLYDSSATGGGVMLNTDGVQLGNVNAQGTVPSSISTMAGSYFMGSMFSFDGNSGGDSGSFTVNSSGSMSGSDDSGGQGYMNYGGSISGMSFALPNSYGVFNIQAGGQSQVTCYLINPVCSGGGTACGGSGHPPYAMNACVDTHSNNPKVTVVQQVQ